MTALYQVWYKNYPQSRFHFINDNEEWLQMDKMGHTFTAYQEGVYGYQMMHWAGLTERQAAWYGGGLGFLLQTPLEILDGFSAHWGASSGDLIANTTGSALFISQQLAWREQKVQMKFSYSPSPYPKTSPNLLGGNFAERIIKDYNGQTYWLSAGIQDITGVEKVPRWLNLAVGYSGNGMLRGTMRDQLSDPNPYISTYPRARQFYLSLDVNFNKLNPRQKWLRKVCTLVAFVKVPAPAIEYRQNRGLRFDFLYF